ncbi:MAG: bifunctional nuclease family protein [Planctomycetes bacterium]|nr:bifunctional nuclease family protein [Planctomycetota bacterium]
MQPKLEKVKIRRIIGPTPSGAAVLLGNDKKTFVVFVGFYEAAALIREINGEVPARPLTHELLQSIFLGFDLEVKQVIISSIIENTFCATLILQQKVNGMSGEWTGKRNEVRIDARPSDCLVLALKNKVDIFVTEEVFSQVQDVSKMAAEGEGGANMSMEALDFELQPKTTGYEEAFEEASELEDDDEPEEDEEEDKGEADPGFEEEPPFQGGKK